MTAPLRFFVPATLVPGLPVTLPREVAQHLAVRRVASWTRIRLFNGHGGEFVAELGDIAAGDTRAQIIEQIDREIELPYSIILAQALSSTEKMDYSIEKSVELGVSSVVPLQSERSVVRLSGDRIARRHLHWQGVIRASCEQCGRNTLPSLQPLMALPDFLRSHISRFKLIASPNARSSFRQFLSERAAPEPGQTMTLLIGPEGGFSDAEQAAAIDNGFIPVSFGERILRTETAGPAALAMAQAVWGV